MNHQPDVSFDRLEDRRLLAADFTVVVMGDSQYITEDFPEIFAAQTAWARDNANTDHNVSFVAHQGDMLRRGYSDLQATNAQSALDLLNGVVPYTVSIGNHDYDNQFDDLDSHISSANFAEHFGDVMFARQDSTVNGPVSGFGGSSLDQRNRYQIITVGAGVDARQFMVLSLEWAAPDASINWAKNIIAANPNIPVILSTHEYLNSAGRTQSTLDPLGNDGQALWEKLIYNTPQIFLVLSGHTGATYHQTSTNAAGLPVLETTTDFEGSQPNGGNGFMQLFRFSPDKNAITVSSYSPYTGGTVTGTNHSFTLPLNFATRFNFSNTPIPFNPTSTAPVANADEAATAEGKAVTINPVLNDTDAEGDAIKAILSSLPANGAVYVNANGTFTYTPDPKFVGTDTFEYYPVDGAVRGAKTTVTVTVNDADARYSYPIAETTSGGTRTGTFANLSASDGVVETFTGSVSHRWTFNVGGGSENTFAVNGWREFNSAEYKLEYSTNGSTWSPMSQIVARSSLSVTRTGHDPAQPYQLWRLPSTLKGTVYIRIVSSKLLSGWHAHVDEMFIMSTGPVPVTIPAAPTSLAVNYNKKTRKATLSWRDNASNETGYRVWYSMNGGTSWSVYTTLGANATSFTTSALTRGTTYRFRISAFNNDGESPFSNEVSLLAS